MAQTPPPNITPTPTPAPQRGDRVTFSDRVDAFIIWLTTAVGQFAALATNVYNNAVDAFQSATTASQAASTATGAATTATTAAASAVNAPGTSGTSTTSLSVSLGTKNLTIAQAGKAFGVGNTVSIASIASPSNKMDGNVTAFDPATGAMTVNVTNILGSGTFTSWNVAVAGAPGLTGVVNEQLATALASAATVNLNTTTGNLVHITGTANISAFTLDAGRERTIVADGAFTLVNGSSLIIPGGRNITLKAGESFSVRGDSSGIVRIINVDRLDGSTVAPVLVPIGTPSVISSAALNIDYLNIFTSEFDKYIIEIQNVQPSAEDALRVRLAVNGNLITSLSYMGFTANGSVGSAVNSLVLNATSRSDLPDTNLTLEISNVNSTGYKACTLRGIAGSSSIQMSGTGVAAQVVSGFRLYWGSGSSFAKGAVRVFGVRNS